MRKKVKNVAVFGYFLAVAVLAVVLEDSVVRGENGRPMGVGAIRSAP